LLYKKPFKKNFLPSENPLYIISLSENPLSRVISKLLHLFHYNHSSCRRRLSRHLRMNSISALLYIDFIVSLRVAITSRFRAPIGTIAPRYRMHLKGRTFSEKQGPMEMSPLYVVGRICLLLAVYGVSEKLRVYISFLTHNYIL